MSIGMPVYNAEGFVKKAIESLLNQSFKDFELIISDNNSTDGTSTICQEYAEKDTRIRLYVQQTNRGPSENFKFVLNMAQCPYFMWAAADDWWEKDCVSKYIKMLRSQNDIAAVFSNYYTENYVTGVRTTNFFTPSVNPSVEHRFLIRMLEPCPSLVYGMTHTEFLREIENMEFDFFDVYCGYYLSLKGKIVGTSDFLYHVGICTAVREPYSITGERITYMNFFRNSLKLINKHFRPRARALFSVYLIYYTVQLMRQYRLRGY